jgi:hypothetical protein
MDTLIREFLGEIDEVFGFVFDIRMACFLARLQVEKIQRDNGLADDSPFVVSDGPPTGTTEQEIERSLHDTTVGAVKARMSDEGYDFRKTAEAAIVFTFHIWEVKYRPALAELQGKRVREIASNVMGDLNLLRNSIIHNKGV